MGGEAGKWRVFPLLSPNAFSRIGSKGGFSSRAKQGGERLVQGQQEQSKGAVTDLLGIRLEAGGGVTGSLKPCTGGKAVSLPSCKSGGALLASAKSSLGIPIASREDWCSSKTGRAHGLIFGRWLQPKSVGAAGVCITGADRENCGARCCPAARSVQRLL